MTTKSEENGGVKNFTTQVYKTWASTEIQMEIVRFTWIIRDFSFLMNDENATIPSPLFSNKTHNAWNWRLILNPSGSPDDNISLSLNIKLESSKIKQIIQVKCKAGILDARSQRINISQFNNRSYEPGKSWCFIQFVNRDFLFDAENGALPDDALTIFCELSFAVDVVQKEGQITFIEPKCDLKDDFRHLFENQKFSDVILCAEGLELHAHKLILTTRSSVFEAMFSHEMEENHTNRIEIKDIGHEILKEMLRYMYYGEVQRLQDNSVELLIAADKYDLKTLKVMCENELFTTLSIENVAKIFEVAATYNTEYLRVQAMEFLVAQSSQVIKTDGWNSLVRTHPHLATEALLAMKL